MQSLRIVVSRLRALAGTPWLLAGLAALVFCYPLGAPFVWLTVAALVALCCVGALPSLAAAYVFLFLFDNMLPFPPLGGSLARVLQVGILLRAALAFWVERPRAARPDRFTWMAALLTAVACGISFLLKGLVGDSLSFGVNMLVLLALRAALRTSAEMPGLLRRLMRVYVASAVAAVAFGVAYNRFFVMGDGPVIRFLGTHEPNFMAMFLNVALVLWLMLPRPGARPVLAWLLDAAVLGTLLGGLLLTGSLTGLLIAGCMLLLCAGCALLRRESGGETRARRAGALGLRLLCGAVVALAVVAGGQRSTLLRPQPERDIYALRASTGVADADTPIYIAEEEYRALRAAGEAVEPHLLTSAQWRAYREARGIGPVLLSVEDAEPLLQDGLAQAIRRVPALGNRLYTALGYARLYGLDAATSGRWGLMVEKLRDFASRPLWQMLLGRGPDPETTYFPLFETFGYSHNSYLDLLAGFGVIGLGLLLWWFARTVRRGQFWGLPVEKEDRGALALARVALLLHAATLSMYLNRVFLFFFIG